MSGSLPPGDPFAPPTMDPTNPYNMQMMGQRVSMLSNKYRTHEQRHSETSFLAGLPVVSRLSECGVH